MTDQPPDEPASEEESALTELARRSARYAIEEIRKDRMWRYLGSALVGLIVALAIMLPTAIVLYGDAKDNSKRQAVANCSVSASSRPQGNARAFVEREILGVATQAYNSFPRAFKDSEDKTVALDAKTELPHVAGDKALTLGLRQVRGFADLAGLVQDLHLITCSNVIH